MEVSVDKVKQSIKIYPLFAAFSDDLIFLVPIDTLFLTIAKGLSASEIQFMMMISLLVVILGRNYLLKLAKKIGNVRSIRFGMFLLTLSIIVLIFSQNFFFICFYKIIYELSSIFLCLALLTLKNNLEFVNREKDY